MITFTFNTPVQIETGEMISSAICIIHTTNIRQDITGLSAIVQGTWYRSIENAIDRFNAIAITPEYMPAILRGNITTQLTTTNFANVDMGNVYNQFNGILEDGDSHGQWQSQWGTWGGFKGQDALNDGVVDMPAAPDAAPTTLVATANGTDTIDLTWAEAATNEFGFVIERSLTTGTGFVEVARPKYNETSYSDTDLQSDTEYFYRIASWNWGGLSAYSLEDSATTAAV